jgi:hypothetical protein
MTASEQATDLDGGTVSARFFRALETADVRQAPYRHWLMQDVLPESVARAITALPFDPPAIGDTMGRRETHNSTRVFFNPETRARFPVIETMVEAFQDHQTIRRLNRTCAIDLTGTSLRIEYCQDVEGFWLEPHTDIRVKKFTMLVYLSTDSAAQTWGTDVYNAELNLVGQSTGAFNHGLIFIPADDTWHGFARRPITGVRRSIIINYVGAEWRARGELADPEHPVQG